MNDPLIERRRDEVIEMLTEAFSRDLLTTEEYEHRVGMANSLNTVAEINGLVSDLNRSSSTRGIGSGAYNSLQLYPAPGQQTLTAYFSEHRLESSDWLLKERVDVRAVLGTVILDLRKPVLGPSTRFVIHAVLGEVKIIVPRGVRVYLNVNPILGEVTRVEGENRLIRQVKGFISSFLQEGESRPEINPDSHPNAVVHIEGRAILGTVKVIVKD